VEVKNTGRGFHIWREWGLCGILQQFTRRHDFLWCREPRLTPPPPWPTLDKLHNANLAVSRYSLN